LTTPLIGHDAKVFFENAVIRITQGFAKTSEAVNKAISEFGNWRSKYWTLRVMLDPISKSRQRKAVYKLMIDCRKSKVFSKRKYNAALSAAERGE